MSGGAKLHPLQTARLKPAALVEMGRIRNLAGDKWKPYDANSIRAHFG